MDYYNKYSPIYILHSSQRPEIASDQLWLDYESLVPAMDAAREVKDDYEIQMIRQANKISGLAHRRILENIHRMSNESEI